LRARAHANDAVVGDGVRRRGGGGAPRRRIRPGGMGKLLPPYSSAITNRVAAAARVTTVWVVGDTAP